MANVSADIGMKTKFLILILVLSMFTSRSFSVSSSQISDSKLCMCFCSSTRNTNNCSFLWYSIAFAATYYHYLPMGRLVEAYFNNTVSKYPFWGLTNFMETVITETRSYTFRWRSRLYNNNAGIVAQLSPPSTILVNVTRFQQLMKERIDMKRFISSLIC